jgi:TolB-like protein
VHEHFVDGVTESLTTDLSRIRGAFLIARNTASTYKGRQSDAKAIGRELNVRYVREGRVQRGANRMRVNVQFIDAKTGSHLWAERFDKLLTDLLDMQDEIAARWQARSTPSSSLPRPDGQNRPQRSTRWTCTARASKTPQPTAISPRLPSSPLEPTGPRFWRSVLAAPPRRRPITR